MSILKFFKFSTEFSKDIQNIVINDVEIEVIKKNIKNIYISVKPPKGKVCVSIPKFIDKKIVYSFIHSKLKWIKNNQRKFRQFSEKIKLQYLSGEYHYFKGKKYLLNIVKNSQENKIVIIDDENIELQIKDKNVFEIREKIMMKWYRNQLKNVLPNIIEKWEKITTSKINEWRIKRMKTRWGTCNIKSKRIWINLELIKFPLPVLECIVLHEILHLTERKHNSRFFSLMYKYMPDWKIYDEKLKSFSKIVCFK